MAQRPTAPTPAVDPRDTHATAAPVGSVVEVQRFRLIVERGADAGTFFVSSRDRTVIGTDHASDLVLKDPTVSRFHCEIVPEAGHLAVRDLGSRNGTLISGIRVVHGFLPPAAVLTLGNTELRLELHSDPVRVALSEQESFGRLVGRSAGMRRVFAILERAAETDATVLIQGETGTGKEVAAEALHLRSPRHERPFVVVDCSAVPGELLESELFGHERGAFTGATAAREGAFELAEGGTVFLDEIGELGLELQPKLLRVLEQREIKRVGSSRWQKVDVRVVAATNRDLKVEVNEKRFRPDLYYRLGVVEVALPPLRDRPDDLPVLIDRILQALGAAGRPEAAELQTPAFFDVLARHRWPGNVRELRNYLDRCLTLRERMPLESGTTTPEATSRVDGEPDLAEPLKVARERWSRAFERRYVAAMLQRHNGNVTAAARAAGIDRMYFYRLLWRHSLR